MRLARPNLSVAYADYEWPAVDANRLAQSSGCWKQLVCHVGSDKRDVTAAVFLNFIEIAALARFNPFDLSDVGRGRADVDA